MRQKVSMDVFGMIASTMGGIYLGAVTAFDDGTSIVNYILGDSAVSLADILEACGMGRQLPERSVAVTILLPSDATNRVHIGRGSGIATGSGNSGNGSVSIGAGESVTALVIDEDTEEWEDNLYMVASAASTDIRIIIGEAVVYE